MEEFLDWIKHLGHEGNLITLQVVGDSLAATWYDSKGKVVMGKWPNVGQWEMWLNGEGAAHVPA